MECENSASQEEEALGHKQRCDEKRAIYRQDLAMKTADGKSTGHSTHYLKVGETCAS